MDNLVGRRKPNFFPRLPARAPAALSGRGREHHSDTVHRHSAEPQKLRVTYRPEIDGLRAFAVTAVIINHFSSKLLPSGYLGVDIFFVISGFVITSSLISYQPKTLGDLLLNFYVKRIKRLVPALIFFVLFSSLALCLFNPNPALVLKTGIASLFGLSNLYLFKQSTDYFAPSTQLNVFTHTWSLGVEEQFYLVFPLLVWFFGCSRQSTRGLRDLFWVTAALTIGSLVCFVVLYKSHQPTAYFLLPSRLWELGAGCLLFLVINNPKSAMRPLAEISPAIVIAGLSGVLFISQNLAVPATFAAVLLTVTLIACLRPGTAAYAFFASRKVVWIGLISYSLYLWHWGVLAISRWTIGIHWWSVPIQLGLMLLLAAGSYRYLERPLRHARWSRFRLKSIGYGLGASLSVAGLLLVFSKIHGTLFTGTLPSMIAIGTQTLTDPYQISGKPSAWNGEKCVVLPDNNEVGKMIPISGCTLGDFENAKHRILVAGNSYSAAFVQAFDPLVAVDNYAVTITSSWGAFPIPQLPNTGKRDDYNNYYWETVVPSLLSFLHEGDWLFLMSDFNFAEFSPQISTDESEKQLIQFELGLNTFAKRLSDKGIRVAVLHGLPFAKEAHCDPVLGKSQWFSPFGGACHFLSKEETLLRRGKLDMALDRLQSSGPIRIVDLMDIFCPGSVCNYMTADGQVLYRDEWAHPSVEAARLSAPIIRNVLLSASQIGEKLSDLRQ